MLPASTVPLHYITHSLFIHLDAALRRGSVIIAGVQCLKGHLAIFILFTLFFYSSDSSRCIAFQFMICSIPKTTNSWPGRLNFYKTFFLFSYVPILVSNVSLSNDIRLNDYVRKLWENEIRCKEVKRKWDYKANFCSS